MHDQGIPTDELGSVGQLEDGRYYVLFERHSSRSIDAVWQAITDPTQLRQWFPEIKLDPQLGGEFQIWFGEGCGGPADVSGQVEVFDPPHTLQFGSMRFELERDDQGCVIRFSDVLVFSRGHTPLTVTNSVLAGWHRFMDLLAAHLQGEVVDLSATEPDYKGIAVPGKHLLPEQN